MACSVDDVYARIQVIARRTPCEADYNEETLLKESIRDARDLVGVLAGPWLRLNSKTIGATDSTDVPAELSDLFYHASAASCCADLGLIEESKLHQEIFSKRMDMFASLTGDDRWNPKGADR